MCRKSCMGRGVGKGLNEGLGGMEDGLPCKGLPRRWPPQAGSADKSTEEQIDTAYVKGRTEPQTHGSRSFVCQVYENSDAVPAT